MKILIAEDDCFTVELYKIGFKKDDVKFCLNGEDFIMAYSDDYDVFILDLMMPVKTGYEVLEFLRGVGNKVPVVVVTAYVADPKVDEIQGALVISKPILTNKLRDSIINYI